MIMDQAGCYRAVTVTQLPKFKAFAAHVAPVFPSAQATADSYFPLLKAEDCRCVAAITSAFLTTASFLASLWTDWFGELAVPVKGWLCLSPRTGHQMPDRPPSTIASIG